MYIHSIVEVANNSKNRLAPETAQNPTLVASSPLANTRGDTPRKLVKESGKGKVVVDKGKGKAMLDKGKGKAMEPKKPKVFQL
jgi:hypothetical protein